MNIFELVESNNLIGVEMLLDSESGGADVNKRTDDRWKQSPLMVATRKGLMDMAKLLVSKGAKIHQKCAFGGTPIYYAACDNQPEAIEFLIQNGAKVNHKCCNGNTPIMAACIDGLNCEAIVMLLKYGARPSIRNDDGLNTNKRYLMSRIASKLN